MISIYVIQILLILFFGYAFRRDKKKFLMATFIVLFVVMAFRNAKMVGNDSSSSYYAVFARIQSYNLSWPNFGLPLIMKIIRNFTNDYQWVIVISAMWICFSYYKLLVKYSENAFISVMWFMGMLFYTFMFSALKQAWAMAFLCFAFDAILKKKPIRFLLFVGLATVFHLPALIFLPAYLIAKLKINRAFPLLMMAVLVIVFIFRTHILNWMTSIYDEGAGSDAIDVRFMGTKVIFMLLLLAFAFYQFFALEKKNVLFSTLIYFMGFAAVIQTFCFYNNIFERLADYYYQYSILFMPMILIREISDSSVVEIKANNQVDCNSNSCETEIKKSIRNYSIEDIDIYSVLFLVITVFCVWRFISITNSGMDNLTPFNFFWEGLSTSV